MIRAAILALAVVAAAAAVVLALPQTAAADASGFAKISRSATSSQLFELEYSAFSPGVGPDSGGHGQRVTFDSETDDPHAFGYRIVQRAWRIADVTSTLDYDFIELRFAPLTFSYDARMMTRPDERPWRLHVGVGYMRDNLPTSIVGRREVTMATFGVGYVSHFYNVFTFRTFLTAAWPQENRLGMTGLFNVGVRLAVGQAQALAWLSLEHETVRTFGATRGSLAIGLMVNGGALIATIAEMMAPQGSRVR
jgi:hypothetical protein